MKGKWSGAKAAPGICCGLFTGDDAGSSQVNRPFSFAGVMADAQTDYNALYCLEFQKPFSNTVSRKAFSVSSGISSFSVR